jgi:hypothetical protein
LWKNGHKEHHHKGRKIFLILIKLINLLRTAWEEKLMCVHAKNTRRQVSINGHNCHSRERGEVSYHLRSTHIVRHLILIYFIFWVLIDNDEYVSRFDSKNSRNVAAPARIHYRYLIESICGCFLRYMREGFFISQFNAEESIKNIKTPQRCCAACMQVLLES